MTIPVTGRPSGNFVVRNQPDSPTIKKSVPLENKPSPVVNNPFGQDGATIKTPNQGIAAANFEIFDANAFNWSLE